jgi:hypothetical protein
LTKRQEWFDLAMRPQASVPMARRRIMETKGLWYGIYSGACRVQEKSHFPSDIDI